MTDPRESNHVMTRQHYENLLKKIVADKMKLAVHMTQAQREMMQAEHRAQFDEECA